MENKVFCNKCKDEILNCDFVNCDKEFKKSQKIYCFGMDHYCSMQCAKNDDKGNPTKVVDEENLWDEDSY